MKNRIQNILQWLLGYGNYLFIFSVYKIFTLRRDKYEKDFFHFVDILPDKGLTLDLGANLGIMTFYMARKAMGRKVVAVEPMPDNLKAMKRTLNFLGVKNVDIYETALGDSTGETEMVLPELKGSKKQGLSHVKHPAIDSFNEGVTFKVKLNTLDNLLENNHTPVVGIKLDVENFEYFVLRGGEKLIKENKPLIYCELWENENRQKCFELLTGWGYEIKVLNKRVLEVYKKGKHQTQNFFFIPKND